MVMQISKYLDQSVHPALQ